MIIECVVHLLLTQAAHDAAMIIKDAGLWELLWDTETSSLGGEPEGRGPKEAVEAPIPKLPKYNLFTREMMEEAIAKKDKFSKVMKEAVEGWNPNHVATQQQFLPVFL